MIRVVFDTNILVSAFLKTGSLPDEILLLALTGQLELCLSRAVYDEYVEVLYRPRLGLDRKAVDNALAGIRNLGHWVEPSARINECSDPDDNIFLECAEAAEADYLVTGNQRHFPKRWKKTQVISVRELIEILMERN